MTTHAVIASEAKQSPEIATSLTLLAMTTFVLQSKLFYASLNKRTENEKFLIHWLLCEHRVQMAFLDYLLCKETRRIIRSGKNVDYCENSSVIRNSTM